MEAAPLSPEVFDRLMAACGPFPASPRLACALSGGPDSLALLLCLRAWAATRDGHLVALTVDHGLRPGSAEEAGRVATLCGRLGVEHRILVWRGDKPRGAVQRAAREARYRLLQEACHTEGLGHLLLAHHRDDQAETVVLRLLAGSGPFGLAAMPLTAELGGLRLLRPLLPVGKARLRATVAAAGLPAEEDPSNRDPRHRRIAVRLQRDRLEAAGLTAERLGDVAAAFGRLRRCWDDEIARLLDELVVVAPGGWAEVDPAGLLALPLRARALLLARLLQAIGGGRYPPSPGVVETLARALAEEGPRTRSAGGCLVGRWRGRLVVAAEARGAAARPLVPGERFLWRGRFAVTDRRTGRLAERPLVLRGLRQGDWGILPPATRERVPPLARHGLPALYDLDGLWAVPHLTFWKDASAAGATEMLFRPRQPLLPVAFTPVRRESHT